jgi:hypothetical protein
MAIPDASACEVIETNLESVFKVLSGFECERL